MKIVINISAEQMDMVRHSHKAIFADVYRMMAEVINNGTPLPKGHGRLIDANSIYQIVRPVEETDDSWGMTAETAIRLIHEAFDRAPTIIEAESE